MIFCDKSGRCRSVGHILSLCVRSHRCAAAAESCAGVGPRKTAMRFTPAPPHPGIILSLEAAAFVVHTVRRTSARLRWHHLPNCFTVLRLHPRFVAPFGVFFPLPLVLSDTRNKVTYVLLTAFFVQR